MIDFLSVGIGRFRKFGNPFQKTVRSTEDIYYHIIHNNYDRDCFLGISEYEYAGDRIVEFPLWFFLDLDINKTYGRKWVNRDAARILNWLESENLNFILDESGAKGLHFLIELEQGINYDNRIFRAFGEYLIDELRLKTVDKKVLEIRRLKRIPGTVNPKSNKLCRTLRKREGFLPNLYNFVDLKESKIEYSSDCKLKSNRCDFLFSKYAPCIYSKIESDDVDHSVRWRWVILENARGKSFNEIYKAASDMGWSDFIPSLTKYQIKYTLDKKCKIGCNKEICIKECALRRLIK